MLGSEFLMRRNIPSPAVHGVGEHSRGAVYGQMSHILKSKEQAAVKHALFTWSVRGDVQCCCEISLQAFSNIVHVLL